MQAEGVAGRRGVGAAGRGDRRGSLAVSWVCLVWFDTTSSYLLENLPSRVVFGCLRAKQEK